MNYNSLDVTCEMLDSVERNSYKNVELILVDNASKEDPTPFLSENYPKVRILRCKENKGFAGGNNLGIDMAKGDFLFFLNNDAELTDGAIEEMLAIFEKYPKAGLVSPKLCFENNDYPKVPDLIQFLGATNVHPFTARNKTLGRGEKDLGQYQKESKVAYAHGAAMMMPRSVLDKVGQMPEEFFLYYEELDWCEEIRRKGFEILVTPKAKVYHKESLTIGNSSPLKTYYLNRNRILFMKRNRQKWQFAIFCLFLCFFTIPKNMINFIIQKDWKNLKAFFQAILWNLKPTNSFVVKPTPQRKLAVQ